MRRPGRIRTGSSSGALEVEAARKGAAALDRPEQLLPKLRPALEAVRAALVAEKEKPEEFFAAIEDDRQKQPLIFHLWHQTAFLPENRKLLGNPGSKCRDALFDPASGKVERFLFWR